MHGVIPTGAITSYLKDIAQLEPDERYVVFRIIRAMDNEIQNSKPKSKPPPR